MVDGDNIVIEALLDDVLDQDILRDATEEAIQLLQGDDPGDQLNRLEAELATIDQERARLVNAIATGGELGGFLDALRTRDRRRAELEAARAAVRSQRRLQASDTDRVRDELMTLADSWRQVLAEDPPHARPILSELLKGRVSFTPMMKRRWTVRGEGTLTGLFSKALSRRYGVPNGTARYVRTRNRRSVRVAAWRDGSQGGVRPIRRRTLPGY
jgi:hypothetical protein